MSPMACHHALSDLRPEAAETRENGALIVKFTCAGCLAKIVKEFAGKRAEPR